MRRAALGGSALLVASLLAGCNDEAPVPDPPSTPTVGKPVALTFMAYGPPEELAAYEAMPATRRSARSVNMPGSAWPKKSPPCTSPARATTGTAR